MRQTQLKRVENILKQTGQVSRNALMDVPYDKILRLSHVILKLRAKGYDIVTDTDTDPMDTIYRLTPKKVETYRIVETGEIFTKKIFV